jgi:hypothetical protein
VVPDSGRQQDPHVARHHGRLWSAKRAALFYLQWQEGGIAPQVVIEVHSPGNTRKVWRTRFEFYERFGDEELYLLDPEVPSLEGWRRKARRLSPIKKMNGWVSPSLNIRFEIADGEMQVFGADGKPFRLGHEKADELEATKQKAAHADRLAARLRKLGIDPDSVTDE